MNKRIGQGRIGLGIGLIALAAVAGAQSITSKIGALANSPKMAVAGKDGWLFFTPELRYLAAGPFWGPNAAKASHALTKSAADPLPAILDFKKQCDKAGVQLIFAPVPAKAAIYPDKLIPGASPSTRIDTAQAQFLSVLRAQGVTTVDLTPVFMSYRRSHPSTNLYSKVDTHWSGAGIGVAADAIAAAVKRGGWYAKAPKAKMSSSTITATVKGDLPEMLGSSVPAEQMKLTSVSGAASNRNSPVVVLGDSHNLIYSIGGDMYASNAGFPEALAARIGIAPDVVAVRGSGATPARINLARRGDNLKGKKVVVWVFTAREFTEGQGWKNIPVVR